MIIILLITLQRIGLLLALFGRKQLKGNQVRILDSPAAVCSNFSNRQYLLCHWMIGKSGKVLVTERVRKPAMRFFSFTAFDGKALDVHCNKLFVVCYLIHFNLFCLRKM